MKLDASESIERPPADVFRFVATDHVENVDRLWILDVDGERLVVDAMYMPTTYASDRAELWQVMESIRFET